MTEDIQNATPEQPAEESAPKKSGSPMKYIIVGVVGIVLVVAVAFATLMLAGGQSTPSETVASETETAPETNNPAAPTDEEVLDSLLAAEGDPELRELIKENLAVLDYEPDPSEMGTGTKGMSEQDSLDAIDWLGKEKKRLAEWEAELKKRQAELTRLDKEVSKKIIRIEQAESARIASLARLYDGMDAKSVARLMTNLDDETVVSILPRMKAKNASQVLQMLPSQRAARLSKKMITIAGTD